MCFFPAFLFKAVLFGIWGMKYGRTGSLLEPKQICPANEQKLLLLQSWSKLIGRAIGPHWTVLTGREKGRMTGPRGTGGDIKNRDHYNTDNNITSNNSRLYNSGGTGSKEKAASSIRSIYAANGRKSYKNAVPNKTVTVMTCLFVITDHVCVCLWRSVMICGW